MGVDERIVVAARSLAVDGVAVQATRALTAAGIRSILLKGPALATWLYDAGTEARAYGDVDLLVGPTHRRRAEEVLAEMGFERAQVASSDMAAPAHAEAWVRGSDSAPIDLHVTLFGAAVPPRLVWEELSARTVMLRVAGAELEVLDLPARALLVAVHVAQHGALAARPLADLERALIRTPPEVWDETAVLAERLEVAHVVAEGLRMVPAGRALAERLRLVDARVAAASRAGAAGTLVLGLDRVSRTPGLWAKARCVLRELFPSADYLRWRLPVARRGPAGLVAAYAWRPLWLLRHLPSSLLAWRRARHAADPAVD